MSPSLVKLDVLVAAERRRNGQIRAAHREFAKTIDREARRSTFVEVARRLGWSRGGVHAYVKKHLSREETR